MLIQFSVSNFLSFNETQTFSMQAGKARKNIDRIFNSRRLKLTKCKVILGANASGKSNLIYALQFVKQLIVDGLPRNFSNKYFRLNPDKKICPSKFEVEILCASQIFVFGFSIILSSGEILEEYLYKKVNQESTKLLYKRDTVEEQFIVGDYFKKEKVIAKLSNYGEDSINDHDILFLSLINQNKSKMYSEFPELNILKDIFNWFDDRLNISFPSTILTGYPYFTNTNLAEISNILNALGTGISELKIVEVPVEVIKNKLPNDLYNKIISDLEKAIAHMEPEDTNYPRIMARSYKEFYTFEMRPDGALSITTIEFSHENKNIYFDLNEESDGTARLLDLIEILFKVSDNRIFVIDEIDRCLHPSLTVKLIELFLSMAKFRNTQLIITSHESRLLASEILRNDEICFMNKTKYGSSVIDPLDKYQLRADKKVYAALFDGTIDAVPSFDDISLSESLKLS